MSTLEHNKHIQDLQGPADSQQYLPWKSTAAKSVSLLGPNGAGKTTCFHMIIGLISCDQGHIHLENTDITHEPMHKRARAGLGYLPQEPSVFRKLSVSEKHHSHTGNTQGPGHKRSPRATTYTAAGTTYQSPKRCYRTQFVRR